MTQPHLPVYIGSDAIPELVRFCQEHDFSTLPSLSTTTPMPRWEDCG